MNKKKFPKKVQFNVRVTPDELKRLKYNAGAKDVSLSEYVRKILVFTNTYFEGANNP